LLKLEQLPAVFAKIHFRKLDGRATRKTKRFLRSINDFELQRKLQRGCAFLRGGIRSGSHEFHDFRRGAAEPGISTSEAERQHCDAVGELSAFDLFTASKRKEALNSKASQVF
jgi:hypothetical protein